MRRCTNVGALLLTSALALGLSACSSHPGSSVTTSTAPTTSSSSSSSTTSGASTTSCEASALAMSVVGSQGAAGTFEVSFGLRNSATTPCTMNGFPAVVLVSGSGTELPTTVVRAGNVSFTNFPAAPVGLSPGATAYFNMAYSDVPVGSETSCEMASQLQVTPPNTSTHGVVAISLAVCNQGTVTVSPVFGSGSPQVQTTAPPHP